MTTDKADRILSPEFKGVDHNVFMLIPEQGDDGLPKGDSLKSLYETISRLNGEGRILSAYTPGYGGAAEAVLKMAVGNGIGFAFDEGVCANRLFGYAYGSFIIETTEPVSLIEELSAAGQRAVFLGKTTEDKSLIGWGERIGLDEIEKLYEEKLEPIYSCNHRACGKPDGNVQL